MLESWMFFVTVVIVQSLLLLIYAHYTEQLSQIPKLFLFGICLGIMCGVPFDLFVGKYLGLYSYQLSFGLNFLVINAVFSYGVFVATVLLIRNLQFRQFVTAVLLMTTIYETANYVFPVWTWHFGLSFMTSTVVVIIGYVGGALVAVKLGRVFIKMSGYRSGF